MVYRLLCGALSLFLLAMPLSATLCISCGPQDCDMEQKAVVMEQEAPDAHSSDDSGGDHCAKMASAQGEKEDATIPASSNAKAWTADDCCADGYVAQLDATALSSPIVVDSVTLERAISDELTLADLATSQQHLLHPPPRPPPRSAQLLHSVFLI